MYKDNLNKSTIIGGATIGAIATLTIADSVLCKGKHVKQISKKAKNFFTLSQTKSPVDKIDFSKEGLELQEFQKTQKSIENLLEIKGCKPVLNIKKNLNNSSTKFNIEGLNEEGYIIGEKPTTFLQKIKTFFGFGENYNISTIEINEFNAKSISKYISNPTLQSKVNPYVFKSVYSKEQKFLLEKILDNPILLESNTSYDLLNHVISATGRSNYSQRLDVLDYILSYTKQDPDIIKNLNICNILNNIKYKGSEEIAKKVLDNPKLRNNEVAINLISVSSKDKNKIVNHILNNEELLNNKTFTDNITDIVRHVSVLESEKALLEVLQRPKLLENEVFIKELPNIISSTMYEKRFPLFLKIINTPSLLEHKGIIPILHKAIIKSDKDSEFFIKMLELNELKSPLLDNSKFLSKIDEIYSHWADINSGQIDLINKIVETHKKSPELFKNTTVQNLLGDLIKHTDDKNIKAKTKIINILLEHPKKFNDEYVNNVLKEIIDLKDFDFTVEFIQNIKAKLNKLTDPVAISEFINSNSEKELKNILQYTKQLDMQQLKSLAPAINDFNAENLLMFLKYHSLKNTTKFSQSSLIFTDDFTQFITQNPVGRKGLEQIFSAFPNTNRNIGKMPEEWFSTSLKNQIQLENDIRNLIGEFQQSHNIKEFEEAMSNLISKKVQVKELGSGLAGTGYKIDVEGSKPVCLKTYYSSLCLTEDGKQLNPYMHGMHVEPQRGLWLNKHSSNYVHMYFGKVAPLGKTDGFIVTQFLDKNASPIEKSITENPNIKIIMRDSNPENFINNIGIDYGGIEIKNSLGENCEFLLFN